MNVKRFVEDDMRLAMARVRQELGKDAVILSTRRVNGRTEITAAVDYDPELSAQELQLAANFAAGPAAETAAPAAPSRGTAAPAAGGPSLTEIQDELARLRKLFEGELAQLAWREKSDRQPNQLALITRLESLSLSRDICQKVVEKVLPCADLEQGWRRALAMLGKAIRVSGDDVMQDGGVIAMVGPTGVGKTTTAAKLAAHFALRHGRKQVAFVTTDNFRVGGQEQLISYGSILGIPVQVATTPAEMRKTLSSLSERKLVLIDTAGMSQRDLALSELFKTLAAPGIDIKPYLVLSAIAQESVISETLKAFAGVQPRGAIITKTDEAATLGPVLSGMLRHRLPAAFIGTGQRVPEDLARARPEYFTGQLLKTWRQGRDQDAAGPHDNNRVVNV